jgi:hypothetical protein
MMMGPGLNFFLEASAGELGRQDKSGWMNGVGEWFFWREGGRLR